MTTLGILQARMGSRRLPGKVLEPILGEPMILRQLQRLESAGTLDRVVVATSVDTSDDVLVELLEGHGVPLVRGPLDDVLDRFIEVIDTYQPDTVVRLTADCPLTSPRVVDLVVSRFAESDADYVSNTLQPTFPDGLDVEVVRPEALRWVAANSSDPHEHEHVTLGVYRRPDRFSVANVRGEEDLSDLRWTVDDPDDLAFVRAVYERLYPGNPAFDVPDILALLRAEPRLSRTAADAKRNAALDGLDTGAMERD